MTFSLFEVILLVGITQGFIMATLIWFFKNKNLNKLILSAVLTVFNLQCIKILVLVSGLWQISFFRYIPLSFDLAIQPLIYFYIRSLTYPAYQFNRKSLLHFIPFALSFAYSLFVYLKVISIDILASKDLIANNLLFNHVKEIEDYLSVISSILYGYLGFKCIRIYRQWLFQTTSNTDYPTLNWLTNISWLLIILIAGLCIDIVLDYLFQFGQRSFIHWQLFFVYLAALIYYLGFKGYQLNDDIYSTAFTKNPFRAQPTIIKNETPASSITYNLAEADYQKTLAVKKLIIDQFEKEKIFIEPELNLQMLSDKIKTNPVLVSAVINKECKKSFRNLVNEYRVEEAKNRLIDPKFSHLSILGIAYESGFNSEASFYRIFKSTVGISPKEFIQQQQNKEG